VLNNAIYSLSHDWNLFIIAAKMPVHPLAASIY